MMKTTVPTKLQKQIIDIVSAVDHPSRFSLHSNTTARCINYWVSGERLPRDIVTIEDVMDAFGYEIVIRRKDDGKDIQSEAEQQGYAELCNSRGDSRQTARGVDRQGQKPLEMF